MNFALPASDKRIRLILAGSKFAGQLAGLKKTPLEQIKLLHGEIRALNRSRIGPRERIALNRRVLTLAYPILLRELQRHSKEGGIPDHPSRRDSLDQAAEVLGQLSYSYLSVFKHHYDGSDRHFKRCREEARHCACRALELIRLKQRVRGLRYQPLSENVWRLINTVFHIMRAYDDVDAPLKTLDSELLTGTGDQTTTMTDVYQAIQLTGRFDILRWPVAFQNLLVGYLDSMPDAVTLQDDQDAPLAREQLIAYCGDNRSAGNHRKPESLSRHAVLLDWSSMAKLLRRDCFDTLQSCRTGKPTIAPEKLRLLGNVEKLALVQLMLRGMEEPLDEATCRGYEEKLPDMLIYVGFRDVYQLAKHILANQGAGKKRFVDLFAERSAVIAEDHTAETESQWYILQQTNKTIRLKTQETAYTHKMAVGSLLAYALGAADATRPRLATVSRLHRSDTNSVIIDLERLAKYAEPVKVSRAGESVGDDGVMHALLIHDPGWGWNLLFPPQYVLTDTVPVKMDFRGQSHAFQLGKLSHVTTDFYLFDIPLGTADLGLSEVPSYPNPDPIESSEQQGHHGYAL